MSAGSTRRLNIRGIDFDLIADTDIDKKPNVKHERVATTGKSMRKMTFQIAEATGFKIVYSKENITLIEGIVRDGQDSEVFYTDIDGNDFHCTGTIDLVSTSTSNGEINITVMPEIDWV
jgi:hypothetical protein